MPLYVPDAAGMDYLGGTELAAQAATSATVTIAARETLRIHAYVAGYASGGGIFGLRFNGDSGTRYLHRNQPYPTTTGTAWGTAVSTASTTGILLANAAIGGGRYCVMEISNFGTTAHPCFWTTINIGTAATNGIKIDGQGIWVSATATQITSVQMYVSGGDLLAGSGFAIFGKNYG